MLATPGMNYGLYSTLPITSGNQAAGVTNIASALILAKLHHKDVLVNFFNGQITGLQLT